MVCEGIGFNEIHRPLQWPQMGIWHLGLKKKTNTDGMEILV